MKRITVTRATPNANIHIPNPWQSAPDVVESHTQRTEPLCNGPQPTYFLSWSTTSPFDGEKGTIEREIDGHARS